MLHWTLVADTTSWGEITHKSSPLCCGSPPLWDHSEALRLELRFVQSHRWSPPLMQLPYWGQPRVAQQGYWFEDLRFFVVFLLIQLKRKSPQISGYQQLQGKWWPLIGLGLWEPQTNYRLGFASSYTAWHWSRYIYIYIYTYIYIL